MDINMNIKISEFGMNITNEIIGEKLHKHIKENLDEESLVIDFSEVQTMTTFCAKQIFGQIINEIGSEAFFGKFSFKNANDSIKAVLTIGISNSSPATDPKCC